MNEELKSCPFCQSHDLSLWFSYCYDEDEHIIRLMISCHKCELIRAIGPQIVEHEDLMPVLGEFIRAWNKRAHTE